MIDFAKESASMLNELNGKIGVSCSENFSPTLRAKLVSFDPIHEVCIMEVVPSPYPSYSFAASKNHLAGERYAAPAWRIWNAYFF